MALQDWLCEVARAAVQRIALGLGLRQLRLRRAHAAGLDRADSPLLWGI